MAGKNNFHRSHVLRGRGLRFVMVDELRQHETLTVADLVMMLEAQGFVLGGRASKVVSDALRWELARGRVRRLARGVYAYGRAPQSTSRRIQLFARQCQIWIVAVMRGEQPPPTPLTPQHRKAYSWQGTESPLRPPWVSLAWLWTS